MAHKKQFQEYSRQLFTTYLILSYILKITSPIWLLHPWLEAKPQPQLSNSSSLQYVAHSSLYQLKLRLARKMKAQTTLLPSWLFFFKEESHIPSFFHG